MSKVKIDTYIDGQLWTIEQLEAIEYQRNQHALHEMKRLGAEILDGDIPLSDDDINYLEPQKAHNISVATRLRLGNEGIRELFKDQLARSDRFWKEINKDWTPDDRRQDSEIEMHVSGVTLGDLMSAIATMSEWQMASANPEHYAYKKDGVGNHGIEAMGMFGNPVAFTAGYDEIVNGGYCAVEVEPGWMGNVGGAVHLESDGTDIHVFSSLQFKQEADGFIFKTAIHWPSKTPKALVDGHKLHYAIEYMEGFRIVAPKDDEINTTVFEHTHIEAKEGSVDGNYVFHCNSKMGETEGTIDFTTDGGVLNGSVSIMGMNLTVCKGSVDGTSFQCSVEQNKMVKVSGEVVGNKITGVVKMGPMKMPFEGERK